MNECFTTNARPSLGILPIEKRAGALAAAAWLRACGLCGPIDSDWDVIIALEVGDHPVPPCASDPTVSRFEIAITMTAWELLFRYRGRTSGIRVTDVAMVNVRDDHGLIRSLPPLRNVGSLIRVLEHRHAVSFHRKRACVRTSLVDAEPRIRRWIAEAL